MKKTTVALAIAGTFAAPAMAQVAMPSGVQLYGRLNLSFDQYRAEGAAAGSARAHLKVQVLYTPDRTKR